MSEHQQIDIFVLARRAGISVERLDRDCSDLQSIASLCDDWELIAYTVGLSKPQINAIKEEKSSPEVTRINFFQKWKESKAKLTYRMLVDAFLQCKRTQQAMEICKIVKNRFYGDDPGGEVRPSVVDRTEVYGAPSHASHYSNTASESSQFSINKNIKDKIRTLDRMFSRVQRWFMKAPGVTLEELKSCLATLPSFQSEAPTPLLEAKTKNEFFHRLKEYCNAQDPDILEDLIEELGDEEAKMRLKQFSDQLLTFQRETKLKDMIGNYDGPEHNMPPNYKEVAIKLGDNWHEKTLEDLKNARLSISLKSGAWLLKLIEAGSLIVTYMVPIYEDLELSDDQRDYLCSQNVMEITMGGKYIFTDKGFTSKKPKETLDLLQSMVESTADNLMKVFQTNKQEENNEKVRGLILAELSKLKVSVLSFAQEAKKVMTTSTGESVEIVPLETSNTGPRIIKSSSTHSSCKEEKQQKVKPKVKGIKRPHPDPCFSQPPPKVPRMSSAVDNKQSTVIDLTTTSVGDEQPPTMRDDAVISGVKRITTPTISPSDKIIGGRAPNIDKQPTSLTKVKKQELTAAGSVRSKGGAKGNTKKCKVSKQPLKRQVKQPRTSSKVVISKTRGRSKMIKPDSKRIRKSRCTEKVKKYCRVCSKPDCGKCKNCLNKKFHKACVEKPIEECITYIAQSQRSKPAPQSDLESSSTSDTDDTTLPSLQPVTKSKFRCRQPPHGSRLNALQSTDLRGESAGDDFHSQLDKALAEESVEILIAKCGVFGPPGSGKSHFKALVSGKKRPVGGRRSTALATEADHIIGNMIDFDDELVEMHRTRDGSKVRWYVTDSKKLGLLVANTLYNHKKPNTIIIHKRHMSSTRREIQQNLIKLLERNLKRKPKCLKQMRLIYLVDTGGQPQFQEIMPIFIRGSSVHFLVHKLNESLDECPRFDYEINGIKYTVPESMMVSNRVYLEQSLRTISSCTFARSIECRTSSRIPRPHFAVIGMFKDKCADTLIDSKQTAVNNCIEPFTKSGKCKAFTPSRRTSKPIFAVDGSEQGWSNNADIIDDIHVNIETFTESLKVKVPIRWFLFLNLLKDASKEKHFVSRKECADLAEKEDIMMNDEDVGKALELFDELNLVLYFPKILPRVVFISPSFLFNKVSEIIVQSFDCVSEDSGVTAQERYDYRKTGILEKGVLDRVKSFQQDFGNGFTQDDLFELLTELCIVAKIDPSHFFVPCVLALEQDDANSKFLRRTIFRMHTAGIEPLVISFSDDYSPRGLFCASVAFLAKLPHWEIDSDSGMLRRNLIGFQVHEWNRELTSLGNVVIVDRLSRFEIYSTCDRKHLCDIRRTISKAIWYAAAKCLAYSPENIDISTGFLCEIDCEKPKPHGTRVLDKDDPQWSMKCTKNQSKRAVKLSNKQLPWFSTSGFKSLPESDSEPTIDQLVDEFGVEAGVTDWQMIALQLDMDQMCVERFERQEEKGIKECFRRVFTKWKKQLKPPFTWAVIIKALNSSVDEEQHKFADKLSKKYLSSLH